MVNALVMTFMTRVFRLTRIQFKSFIQSITLFTSLVGWLIVFAFNDVCLCEGLMKQSHGFRGSSKGYYCWAMNVNLGTTHTPSDISCVYHCSRFPQCFGALYRVTTEECTCCAEYVFQDDRSNFMFYTISRGNPRDCGSLVNRRKVSSGVYTIFPDGQHPVKVFCDVDDSDGPWTVIQRRVDDTVPFNRPYKAYQEGFGDLTGNFWLGLDTISTLTLQKDKTYSLKVVLKDTVKGVVFETYPDFKVMNSSIGYMLILNGKMSAGNAGDSLSYHNGMAFSTFDRDRDTAVVNCAENNNGGWWFADCYQSHLNGEYGPSGVTKCIIWEAATDYHRSAQFATMKLKEKTNYIQ